MALALLILMAVVIGEGLASLIVTKQFLKWLAYVIEESRRNNVR